MLFLNNSSGIVMEALSREFKLPYHGSCCMLVTWLW